MKILLTSDWYILAVNGVVYVGFVKADGKGEKRW